MMAVVLVIALAVSLKGSNSDDDKPYRDQDGDHFYYDKSIIEKKRFHKLYPKQAARSFARLFKKN